TRRRAAGGDRDGDGRALDNGRGCEIAKIGPVDDVDEKPVRAQRLGRSARGGLILERDETDGRAMLPRGNDPPPCPRDEPRLGLGRGAGPDDYDGSAGKREEEGELVHEATLSKPVRVRGEAEVDGGAATRRPGAPPGVLQARERS